MDSAIIPLTTLSNRSQKRQFEREALRVMMPLEEVNSEFLYMLFDEECTATYNGLYQTYQRLWLSVIDELVRTRKFTIVAIDKYWFERNYSPYGNA